MKQIINLRLTSGVKIQEVLHYVQYATEIPVVFNFADYTIPSGATARFYVQKPSGKEVYNEVTVSGNTVVLNPTGQTFAEYGIQLAQLQIIADEKVLMSYIIKCDIEKNIIAESAIPSKDEFGILDELIKQAEKDIAAAEAATKAANEAKANADTAAQAANAAADNANTAADAATKVRNEAEAANAEAAQHEQAAKEAQAGAEAAKAGADEAKQSAENWSKLSESYAHGQTDYAGREDTEDTDNAKYYAEQASASKDAAAESETAAAGSAADAAASAKTAQSIAQGQKGYYETADALKEAFPTGEDGDWAIVGDTDTIWIWDATDSAWEDSGNKTDLTNYYTKTETDGKLAGKSDTTHTHSYAGSASVGGAANSVAHSLTAGSKKYNGSEDVTLTNTDVGAAAASHTHAVGQITGVLPVANGGTGQTTIPNTLKSYFPTNNPTESPNFAVFGAHYDGNGYVTPAQALTKIGAAPASHTHSYLPLSGGTMTGQITAKEGNNAITISASKSGLTTHEILCTKYLNSDDTLYFGINAATYGANRTLVGAVKEVSLQTGTVRVNLNNAAAGNTFKGYFQPSANGTVTLGTDTNRFYKSYVTQTESVSSDERRKEDIAEFDDSYAELFSRLRPVHFRLKNNSDKIHFGFVAQDVAKAMQDAGMEEQDYDFIEKGEDGYYALAYSEFIALNTYIIQKQQSKIEELEARIAALEEKDSARE